MIRRPPRSPLFPSPPLFRSAVLAEPASFNAAAGDFVLWNELQSRGHIIHPHGQTHVKLSDIPPQQAIDSVRQCLDALDRKSTRLNSSHGYISYAVFCLKKKK